MREVSSEVMGERVKKLKRCKVQECLKGLALQVYSNERLGMGKAADFMYAETPSLA